MLEILYPRPDGSLASLYGEALELRGDALILRTPFDERLLGGLGSDGLLHLEGVSAPQSRLTAKVAGQPDGALLLAQGGVTWRHPFAEDDHGFFLDARPGEELALVGSDEFVLARYRGQPKSYWTRNDGQQVNAVMIAELAWFEHSGFLPQPALGPRSRLSPLGQ